MSGDVFLLTLNMLEYGYGCRTDPFSMREELLIYPSATLSMFYPSVDEVVHHFPTDWFE